MSQSSQSQGQKQQWEQHASPGHVLYERVNSLHPKTKLAAISITLGIAICIAGMYASVALSGGLQKAGAWLTTKLQSRVDIPDEGPAPQLLRLEAGQRMYSVPAETLTSDTDAAAWIRASLTRLDAGQAPEFCDYGHKVTEDWLQGDGSAPGCRKSGDGQRIWIWAVVRQSGAPQALAGVFRKVEKHWTFHPVLGPQALSSYPVVSLKTIPRTVAKDLPELVAK